MDKLRVPFGATMILILVLASLGFSPGTALADSNKDSPKADPRLLDLAAAYPDEVFHVIVQRDAKNKELKTDDPVVEIESVGGTIDHGKKMDFVASFAAELAGKEVLKLARHPGVRWISFDAPMLMQGGFGSYTYRDEFNAPSYSGTNGTEYWSANPWVEIGEADGVLSGSIKVVSSRNCALGYCLRIGSSGFISGDGAYRKARLSYATSATLTFSSRLFIGMPTSGRVNLQISPDSGLTWTTLDTFLFIASDASPVAKSYDLTPYVSSTILLRFLGDGIIDGYLYVDNFQIDYARLSNSYIRTTQTNEVWATNATPGEGVTVAVVDSGIANHLDLYAGSTTRVVASVDFSGSPNPAEPIGYDDYGHGTHVAGIIAGRGQASLGARVGNAPSVNLVNVKVSAEDGSSYISNVIAGLQWIYDNHNLYNIKVVNISMNSAVPESYNSSPLDAAVEILWFNGITVVVSAGNNGTGTGPVVLLPPANDPFVITVGASDDMGTPGRADDTMPAFSAYGTTENGFTKPDLVAPGRNIISLLASTTSTAYVQHPANRVDANYFRMSGTSMAAPMVSGAVALMLQQDPTLTPDQIKYRLTRTANYDWPDYDPARAGAGLLNSHAAVEARSTASANTGIDASAMLTTGSEPAEWSTVGWDSVGWNTVGWNSVGWNSVGWNSVGWNTVGWNTVGWNTSIWDP